MDNKTFLYTLSSNNKKFFFKQNGNTINYVTLEEMAKLSLIFTKPINIMKIDRGVIKGKSLVWHKNLLAPLTLSLLLSGCQTHTEAPKQIQETIETTIAYEENLPLEEKEEELVVDTYLQNDWLKFLYIYDMNYLNLLMENESITKDEIYSNIDQNEKIGDTYKNLLKEYITMVENKYPKAEKRIFNENVKTLEVIECTKDELMRASLSVDSYACYIRSENKIYVLKDYVYEKGTWEYQVIMHEFSHMLRTLWREKDDWEIKVQLEGLNYSCTSASEALNSLFTVSLFDYEEKDIAYQLQSNIYKVLISCLDNYSLEDYVNHSLTYFAKCLDETTKDKNYATTIMELIDIQYKDFHSETFNVDPKEYEKIYEYISNLYYQKYFYENMTYEEGLALVTSLVNEITYDVPEEYNIDTNYFYQYYKDYYTIKYTNELKKN